MNINATARAFVASAQPAGRRSRCNGDVAAALLAVLAIGAATIAPAAALVQGPNSPSSVVNDPSVGTQAWDSPQNAATSDDLYASFNFVVHEFSVTSQYLNATGFGFAIPNGVVIQGIEMALERKGGASTFDAHVNIVKGGTIGSVNKALPDNWVHLPFVDEVRTYGGDGDLWGETWTPADINSPNFGVAFSAFGDDFGFGLVDSISLTVFYAFPICGDGQINNVGEECDDGNNANGDCCSATCQLEPAGYPCSDSTVCNGDETCDGAGVCQPGTPLNCDDQNLCTQDSCNPISGCVNDGGLRSGCRTALKSILVLKDKSPDTKDKLLWKWVKGQMTTQNDFGVPSATTQYALCIHAGTAAALLASYNVAADAVKWSALGTKGYKYTDPAGSASGITKVLLKGGAQDKAKCLVKGRGANLDDFDLTDLVDPVTVQLVNSANATCFDSTFNQSDFIKFGDPAQFKAKAQ